MVKKIRLDEELLAQGFFSCVGDARRSIMAGEVSGTSERYTSCGMKVVPGCFLHVKDHKPYVSRGGFKLAGALDSFGVDPAGLACVDAGCSTGGFTDCLLKRGAASVLSVDVGYAQFDWSLRNDRRVTLLERTNICELAGGVYAQSRDLAVCDVSFTSVCTVLPAVVDLLKPEGRFLTLVKPQFEAGRQQVGEGGIVGDDSVRLQALTKVAQAFSAYGLDPVAAAPSSILGTKGNKEYLLLGVAHHANVVGTLGSGQLEEVVATDACICLV